MNGVLGDHAQVGWFIVGSNLSSGPFGSSTWTTLPGHFIDRGVRLGILQLRNGNWNKRTLKKS